MSDIRNQVCSLAAAWLNTPYHHHARIKGVGVDCVHLLCAVLEEAGLTPAIDPGWYERAHHLHKDEEIYADALDRVALRTLDPQPGDIVLFKFFRTHSHAGFVVGGGDVIHAFTRPGGLGSVVKTSINQKPLADRQPLFWDITTIRKV